MLSWCIHDMTYHRGIYHESWHIVCSPCFNTFFFILRRELQTIEGDGEKEEEGSEGQGREVWEGGRNEAFLGALHSRSKECCISW